MKVIQGGVNIPVSMKMDENNHPTAWMVGLGASYASMDNKDLSEYMESQIFNAQLAVSYIRPLSKRWSLLASAGVGLFMNTGMRWGWGWRRLSGICVIIWIWGWGLR